MKTFSENLLVLGFFLFTELCDAVLIYNFTISGAYIQTFLSNITYRITELMTGCGYAGEKLDE